MNKSFIETKYFTVLLHFLIWSTFFSLQILSYQASFGGKPERIVEILPGRFYYRFVFQASVMVVLYYLNTLVFIPKLLFRNKLLKFALAIVVTIILIYLLNMIFNHKFDIINRYKSKRPPIIFFTTVFILALSTSVKLLQKWFENEAKQKEMMHEKVNSELSALKSQINPHFLYNTLNGIYSLANSKSDKAAPAIVKLSRLMRYMLDDSKQNYVLLSLEIDYIETFIELQKLRLFDNVKIEFNTSGNFENIKIQPLLLIPFIENAFKHGVDSSGECFIGINLAVADDSILLVVKNDIIKAHNDASNSGFGLTNIKRRLNLEYPEKHVLTTEIQNNVFITKLFISLTK